MAAGSVSACTGSEKAWIRSRSARTAQSRVGGVSAEARGLIDRRSVLTTGAAVAVRQGGGEFQRRLDWRFSRSRAAPAAAAFEVLKRRDVRSHRAGARAISRRHSASEPSADSGRRTVGGRRTAPQITMRGRQPQRLRRLTQSCQSFRLVGGVAPRARECRLACASAQSRETRCSFCASGESGAGNRS